MFLIVWLFLINTSSAQAQQNASPATEKLIEISELNLVFPILENSLKMKLKEISDKPKYPCNAKCKAAMERNMHDLEQSLPQIKTSLKSSLATELQKSFDDKSVNLLLTVYQSNSFQRLRKMLPALPTNKKRVYPIIGQPINLATVSSAAAQNKISKEEAELLKKVVVHPVFIKFNTYVVNSKWAHSLDEKRRVYGESIKNPFE